MREIGRKLREPGKGIFEPVEHVVESDRDRLQLARPFRRRDAFVEPVRADALQRLGHRRQGPQTSLRHRDRDHRRGENSADQDHGNEQAELLFKLLIDRAILRHLNREGLPVCFGHD